MDALTARSIQRLCGRLEAMQGGGAIPALMAEYRVGAPEEERQPLSGFEGAVWGASVRQLPEKDSCRTVWLAADGPRVTAFRATCADAARVVIPTLRQAGFAVGLGATNETNAWLWSIFEMAALQLPGVPLRLEGGDIYRVGAGGVTMNEPAVIRAAADPSCHPFAPFILTAGQTRYWKLMDAIEASLAVLDIAQTWPQPDAGGTKGDEEKHRKQKRTMRPEEHLVVLYMRDPSVATLESRSLPAKAEQEFGERYSDKSYRETELYGEWRAALEESTRRHGPGWLEGDVLEAGLEIYGAKPGRSDKRGTLDPKNEAAVKAFLRDTGAATARARARLADAGG